MSLSADRILVDAVVWTGVPGHPPRPGWGIAIREGRILAVGPSESLLGLRGARTSVHSVEGRTILPGFVDAHVHLLSGGLDLFRLELRGIRSPEELAHRVADRARLVPPGEWILGGGWDENSWGGPLPDRSILDRVAPDHPVFLLRSDLHVGLANSEALRRAGITPDTPDPPLGRIDRGGPQPPASGRSEPDSSRATGFEPSSSGTVGPDPAGTDPSGSEPSEPNPVGSKPTVSEPTGILRESAIELMSRVIPPPSAADREAALRGATRHALSLGVTQVHDMGALQSAEESWASLRGLRALHREGRLPIRVYAQIPLSERAELARWIAEEGRGDERLRWGGVKGFVDGTLGARTAWMRDPYVRDRTLAREEPSAGGPITDPKELEAAILEAAAMGLQPMNHAIGDRASEWLLRVYATVPAELRPRIEHAQHMTAESIRRAGRRRIHLSMQPAHLVDDGPWAAGRIGESRVAGAFAFRSLIDAGARVSFGSDWTVAPMDPRRAVEAATSRVDREGRVFGPGQELTLIEALAAHTREGAHAGFWEDATGTLEPGKWADLVVIEGAPFGEAYERRPEPLPEGPRPGSPQREAGERSGRSPRPGTTILAHSGVYGKRASEWEGGPGNTGLASRLAVVMTFVAGALMWRRDDRPLDLPTDGGM